MSTQIINKKRGSDVPDRWSQKAPDNRKKVSTNTPSNLSGNCAMNSRTNALRHAASNTYQLDNPKERDLRFRGEKISDDTGDDIMEMNIDKRNLREYSENGIRKNAVSNRGECEAVPRRPKVQYADDCPEFSVPEAMMAVQKLQKLKELQRRRDLTERYYSHEIRRLIGEQYFGPRNIALPPLRVNEKLQSSNAQLYSGDRFRNVFKSLEPCGTMTTITQLDCGCIQETTRPIFTTSRGRVFKKLCNQSQNEFLLEVSSPKTQEHLHATFDVRKSRNNTVKSRKRYPLENSNCRGSYIDFADDFEIMNQRRHADKRHVLQANRSSKIVPVRRYSDSSIANLS